MRKLAAARDVGKSRAAEIKADYMNRVEEKQTREEEEKFQGFIDEQYKAQDELNAARENAAKKLNALDKEYEKLKFNNDKKANRSKAQYF